MSSLRELARKKLAEQKGEIKPDKKPTILLKSIVEKKTLHPPKPPKPVKMVSDDFFVELANSTEFKRFIYKVLYGKVHRTEKQHGNLDEKVKVGLEIFQEFGRGTKKDFRDVVKELKEKLAKQKVKVENE